MVFDYNNYISARDGHFRYHDAFAENSDKQITVAYRGPNLNVADDYSKTTSLEVMKKDQLQKLHDFGGVGKDYLFLLSWTLTPNVSTFFGGSIQVLAAEANQALPATISQLQEQEQPLPNIVYVDFINASVTSSIIQLNFPTKSL
jgi:1-phosphatidylinositol phosphodiesterase